MLLRDVLNFPILQRAGVRVVVDAGLDRPIRWAHTGEIADIAQYLKGGEVLLTAATGLAPTREARRRYIRELSDAGAAAVIIELGRAFRKVPAEMVEEAAACGLVLAVLEHEVPFVEVTQQVHTAVLSEQHEVQERATAIGDDIARLVADGEPVPVLLELLAERFQNPIVLEDGARHVVGVAGHVQPIAPILRSWLTHSRQGHQGGSVGVQHAESEPRCVWSSIVLRGEIWGRLHVLEVDTPLDRVSTLALGRVASNIALHLLAERDAYLSETAERSLVGEVVRGVRFSGDEFLARATGLGVDFERDLVMLVVGPVAGADQAPPEIDEQTVRDAFRGAGWPSLVGVIGGRVAVVASATPRGGVTQILTGVGEVLGGHAPPYHVGVSRPARATMLHRAFAEAQTAHQLGPSTGRELIHHYDELVLHRLLTPLLQAGPELANFIESELGELIAYDEEHRSELVSTLDTYLQANGSKAATAEALFLQRRSVYYRLTRIEEILERSIETPDHRVRLYLALRARELLDSRTPNLV